MKPLYGIALLALVAGCAGQTELRSVSGRSAKMLTRYNVSLKDFAAGQSALNAETEARIQRFAGMRLERAAEIGARVDSWKYLDDKTPLHRFEVISANDADDLIAAASPQLAPDGLPALKFDAGEVAKVVKQLVELQKPLTLEQRVTELITFGKAVYTKDLQDAVAETKTAAITAKNAGAAVESNLKETGK